MGHDVDHALAHQRRQPDRRPAIIGEHEERAAVRNDAAMQRQAVHRRGHAVLADAVMDIGAREVARLDDRVQLGERAVRACQIGRAADQTGDDGQQLLDHLLRGLACGERGSVAAEISLDGIHRGGKLIANRRIDRIGEMAAGFRIEPLRRLLPPVIGGRMACAGRPPARQDRLRHLEGRMMPAEALARAVDLVLAKRRAMGRGGALLGRGAVADDGAAGDQRRPVGDGPRILDGERHGFRVMAIDPCHMPMRRGEALELIVGHRQVGRAVDGDLIVVEQHDQAAELEMTGERDRLLADAFHEAAVAGDHVSMVVDDLIAIAAIEETLGERHADGIARAPAPTGRWWSRCREHAHIRDGPACASRAGGSA